MSQGESVVPIPSGTSRPARETTPTYSHPEKNRTGTPQICDTVSAQRLLLEIWKLSEHNRFSDREPPPAPLVLLRTSSVGSEPLTNGVQELAFLPAPQIGAFKSALLRQAQSGVGGP